MKCGGDEDRRVGTRGETDEQRQRDVVEHAGAEDNVADEQQAQQHREGSATTVVLMERTRAPC